MGIIGIELNKERLLEILCDSEAPPPLKTEIAVVLCSLAHGREDHVRGLVAAGVVPPLFNCLSSGNLKLVEASSKALRAIFQYPFVSKAVPFVVEVRF